MSESERLVKTLKQELRRQGRTYADLTEVLELSHASVKRLFAERNFSLTRLEKICRYLGMDLADLVNAMERSAERIDELTIEQERQLVADAKFLCLAHALLSRWTFDEIIETYRIEMTEGIHYLAMLDRMGLIEMLPGNRYKLLVSRSFRWIRGGPIQRFFEKQLQSDFLDASFNGPGQRRLFVSTMLSSGNVELLARKLEKLAAEINEMHLEDEKLPLPEKRGISVLLAARPWETAVFTALRRKPAEK
ncbi:MAG: helix-turn-helix transcriptional regulator [Gammaproteobacteria bacterium]|nr:helix-turn-helix transcriptional regulator [Pseudomonadales bacterium]MCP5347431.1 helix-turn-helix transcriptional regulator [Pseudomonadales bacterium]